MSAAEKRRFMSGKVADLWSAGSKGPEARKRRGETEEDKEFKGVLREVLDFVMPQMGKRERQQYEAQKVRALGGTLDKGLKMPYWLVQKSQKKLEAQRQAKLEEDKLLGVATSASAHRLGFQVQKELRKKKEAAKDKKRKKEDRLYDIGMGAREKNGMAVIPKRQVNNYARRAGKSGGRK